jgi:hypothetical protein
MLHRYRVSSLCFCCGCGEDRQGMRLADVDVAASLPRLGGEEQVSIDDSSTTIDAAAFTTIWHDAVVMGKPATNRRCSGEGGGRNGVTGG